MITQKDEINSFIPDCPKMIFLGTMCAINARTIDGIRPQNDFFYYNDNRNHFWKILQYLMSPESDPKKLNIEEKKIFLSKHQIGIQNIVSEIQIPNKEKLDPSDSVLFECQNKKRIKFKSVEDHTKELLKGSKLYFTCRYKKGIQNLLEGFIAENSLSIELIKQTHFLKSPTRCNPLQRSKEWRLEMGLN